MKKMNRLMLLLMALLLCGCQGKAASGKEPLPQQAAPTVAAETTQPTIPETTAPDGNPEDVTCKGSYTGEAPADTVVARVGDAKLTNGQLQSWYWAAVAQYRMAQEEHGPDFGRPLDTQTCGVDGSVNSWQQYFLRQALEAWHSAQAMYQQAQTQPLTTEEAYQPNADTHERCMTGMPATKFLYGYNKTYAANTMHQAYLDAIPQLLETLAQERGYAGADAMAQAMGTDQESLEDFAWLYNYAYTYLTFLSYELAPTQEETEGWFVQNEAAYAATGITRDSGTTVDILQVLLIPESQSEADVSQCQEEAQTLLKTWKAKTWETEATFSELAHAHSQDAGTAASGGAYRNLLPGQLPSEIEQWCFAPERQPGDTTILTTQQGVHILFFAGSTPIWQAQAQKDVTAHMEQSILETAREAYPMEVDYSAIRLSQGEAKLSYADVLYPDIAHERYPEVPLYLQQDYPYTWYGNYKISSHGCGITTFSMLTTYMSDEEWTPPEMCDRYGNYSFSNGTDGMIFINEPSKFHYFFRERTYDSNEAKAALEEGYIVVSIQHKGYWTRGGHYILLEKLTEDGMVQVRDSNIANYAKLPQHQVDKHEWFNTTYASDGYWIFDKKVTHIDACSRCGTPDSQTQLVSSYVCEKCEKALTRRNAYLPQS